MSFTLHPQLAADTLPVGDLPLCRLLLMDNANFPWLILVPRRAGLRELFDLEPHEYTEAMQETRMVAEKFSTHTGAHKMNIAALGNMVPQLHIHIIARFEHDVAWPAPIWNSLASPHAYGATESQALIAAIRRITNL